MKKLALAAAAASVILFTGAAWAADMAPAYTKAAPMAAVYNWTGFYIGGNVGGGSATAAIEDNACFFCAGGTHNNAFATGGAQIGYNYQFGNGLVGFEADVNANGIKHNIILGADFDDPLSVALKSDVSGTIRGRVGLALNNALIYATGGAAWADAKFSGVEHNATTGLLIANPNAALNSSATVWGAVIGFGAEFAISPNWSVGAEFLHTAYQHFNSPFVVPPTGISSCGAGVISGSNCFVSSQMTTDVARIRFNYKIN